MYRGFHPTPMVPAVTCGELAPRPWIQITNDHVPDGQEGVAYSVQLRIAPGASGDFTYSGLPAGLSGATNGTISGTPTTAGDYTIQATLTDGDGQTITQPVPITILPA